MPAEPITEDWRSRCNSRYSPCFISPDFRPAYDPLLKMAAALAPSDEAASLELLHELARVEPARPEAAGQLSRDLEAGLSAH